MKQNSYAKVNLALNVINKSKPKSLHDLDMLNVIIDLKDEIFAKFIKDNLNKITIKCNNEKVPTNEDNLVYKVVEKFKKVFNLNFSIEITINKNIPLEAGLAGGSSNAAATLHLLDKKFKTKMTMLQKMNFLESLTSDGPYMVLSTHCRVKGFGNIVTPLISKFKGKILIIKPFSNCSTKEIYSNLDYKTLRHPNMNKIEEAIKNNNYSLLAQHIDNSLIDSACSNNKDILDVLNKLKECGFEIVSMTGSGSACFAISSSKEPYKKYKNIINPADYYLCKVFKIK